MGPKTGNRDQIQVQDLFEGAFLLCRGFEIKNLTVKNQNGRKIAFFYFEGENIKSTQAEYRQGQATCNIAFLKFTLDNLKDQMFKKFRELERQQYQNLERKKQDVWITKS